MSYAALIATGVALQGFKIALCLWDWRAERAAIGCDRFPTLRALVDAAMAATPDQEKANG